MITDAQRNVVRERLILGGLTFRPLQEEMLDHICCDVEEQMNSGLSFENALEQTLHNLPTDHFRTIQNDTMETINKRFALSRGFSYAGLATLFISLSFKVLHLQYSGELLIVSFALIAAALASGSVSGIYFNRGKRGALSILAIVGGTIMLLTGFAFRILHFPGGTGIILISVVILAVSCIFSTFYVYHHATGEDNLLTYLHRKYTPGIERFLLILVVPLTLYKVYCIVTQTVSLPGDILLLIAIFGAGLQFLALSWRSIEEHAAFRNPMIATGVIGSFLCLLLIFLGEVIPYSTRIVLVMVYNVVTAALAIAMTQHDGKKSWLVVLPALLFVAWGFLRLAIIPSTVNEYLFNIPVLIVLGLIVFINRKYELARTFMILSLASYVFEFGR